MKKIMIANRGEIAIRVNAAAQELGLETVAIYADDDAESSHRYAADEQVALQGQGPAAYLDQAQVVALATRYGCDGIHPGYGFLSERPEFAEACAAAGVHFIGPSPEQLRLFGDKANARALARRCDVPVLPGTEGALTPDVASAFVAKLGPGAALLVKAVAGGGGRGMRVVDDVSNLSVAIEQASREALAAFGNGEVYLEQRVARARHIEVQVVGDGQEVVHLWERECTVQRQHQKLVEVAPSPSLNDTQRSVLAEAALRMARNASYKSLGTFEFLVNADNPDEFYFIEANPRLQVEHTVTEMVCGVDLVQAQLRIAGGERLQALGLSATPRGFAIQCRVNMEQLSPGRGFVPTGGILSRFEVPCGPGVRVDHFGRAGYATSSLYDSLLAKVIVHSPAGYAQAVGKAKRALSEFQVEGLVTNQAFLLTLLESADFAANDVYTRYVDEHLDELAAVLPVVGSRQVDPLAVLEHGRTHKAVAGGATAATVEPGTVVAPLQGTVVELSVAVGDRVRQGQSLCVLEAMKMEHVLSAEQGGVVQAISVAVGTTVQAGAMLLKVELSTGEAEGEIVEEEVDVTAIRPDLEEALARHAVGLDAQRPEAVAKRHGRGLRTARENLADLMDPGSFVEYGALTIAAQRRRREVADLIRSTPADGMVAGIGKVNGELFPGDGSRCMLLSYDYMVMAGTQGLQNHRKKDRMFELAEKLRLPVVLFAEGGGGRPGDTDTYGIAMLDCLAFSLWGKLSGLVPRVGIVAGRCFAGNAALLGASDVVIAVAGANIGMGGPAMIEGGGLGTFRPEEVGPVEVHIENGVVDVAVADEAEAVAVARKYLGYFQGTLSEWSCPDQRLLRQVIPENRLRVYDIRKVLHTLFDTDSVLELRPEFGKGMVTAFARVEGRPVGVIANNPGYLSGAIDSQGADKAARFLQLCDAFDIPVVSLCDTPGIMVGPEVEKTALVRHAARLFVTAGSLTVPYVTVVLRKGYGLGAQAMAGGSFKASTFTVTWPTGEFGAMGLEGAVKLGFRKELAAIEDPAQRQAAFQELVDAMYEQGKAVNYATAFELDAVIDPQETRRWIMAALESAPPPAPRAGKKRPCVDTW